MVKNNSASKTSSGLCETLLRRGWDFTTDICLSAQLRLCVRSTASRARLTSSWKFFRQAPISFVWLLKEARPGSLGTHPLCRCLKWIPPQVTLNSAWINIYLLTVSPQTKLSHAPSACQAHVRFSSRRARPALAPQPLQQGLFPKNDAINEWDLIHLNSV